MQQAVDPSKMKRLVWRQLGMEFLFKEATFYYVQGPKSSSDGSSRNIGVDVHADDPERVAHILEESRFEVLIGYG